ncbi:MAG: TonB-dependent receptor, partial [Bacteroidales bacterium]|nr:TonB-dependent receptor [Bacteroidales bacterium]
QQVGWNMRDISDGRLFMRWSNNPFWSFENVYAADTKDRVYGNIGLKIDLMEGLTFTATGRTDFYSLNVNDRVGSGGTVTDYYGESTISEFENNFEGILNYSKKFTEDWSLNAWAGGNIRYSQYKSSSIGTVDGLVIENFYHISNTVSPANSSSSFSERQTNSLFASASLGYKDMLYLDLSGRNDWSSTLPVDNNSYFYPAISTSFVFSELLDDNSFLSMGKFRASYAMVGNDTYAYRLYDTYDVTTFGPTTTFSINNTRKNPFLKNETTAEFELGLDASFINGKVGFGLTYFTRKAFDQIIPLDISATSSYSRAYINAGELQNTGFEALLYGTPVKTNSFSWDISFNFSTYKSKLNSLYGDLTEMVISDAGSAWVVAEVGGEYGVMYASNGYVYDDAGNKVVGTNGLYESSGEPVKVGNILPDFNGGIMNTFNYKGIVFSALIDFQKGGLVYSYANRWATGSGQSAETVGSNDLGNSIRMDPAMGGGVKADGVFADGTPNDVYVDARDFYRNKRNFQEEFMYETSFVKLRELKLGYTLPKALVSKAKLQAVTISVVARNVALLSSFDGGFDPEQVNTISNTQGYEGGSLPSTRSIGFNISLKF